MHADLGDRLRRSIGADVLAILQLSDDLHVRPLGQPRSVFRRAAKQDAAMPGHLRALFAGLAIFPGAVGRDRQRRHRRFIPDCSGFGVVADVANQSHVVQHFRCLLLPPSLDRGMTSVGNHTRASEAAPKSEAVSWSALLGGPDGFR